MSKLAAKKSYLRMAQSGLTPGKIVLLAFLSLLFALFLAIYLFLEFYVPILKTGNSEDDIWGILDWDPSDFMNDSDGTISDSSLHEASSTENPLRKGCYGFLIAGKDYVGWNTDVIMYVMFDTKEDKISVAQFPRDSYINSINAGHRINGVVANARSAALKNGKTRDEATVLGIRALAETIRITFGVPVNYYVFLDLKGFKALVDIVGGVEIYVPFHMKYTDPYQDLYIDLPQGLTLLDGNKAEQFVRFRQGDYGYRDYLRADIDRLDTQKEFLAALMIKLAEINLTDFGKIQELAKFAEQNITTNINMINMLAFAKEVLQAKPENIRMFTMPGEWNAGVGYYSLYKQEAVTIINNYFNPYENEITADKFNIKEWSRYYANLADLEGKVMGSSE